MKQIETLVDDIYQIFREDTPPTIPEEATRTFGQRLGQILAERISERSYTPYLRLSNLGTKCNRKLWYSINAQDQAEPLSPATRIKFLIGDISEALLLFFAKISGHTVEHEQAEVEFHGVRGHIDGVVDRMVLDCKSASSQSFSKFQDGLTGERDDFGYLTQLQTYNRVSKEIGLVDDGSKAAFLVLDKQHGHITLDIHPSDDVDYKKVIDDKRSIISNPEPPERAFTPVSDGKSGNHKLATVCSYCEFKHTCWPGVRTFLYSNGPRFLTTVSRLPNVIEVDRYGKVVEGLGSG